MIHVRVLQTATPQSKILGVKGLFCFETLAVTCHSKRQRKLQLQGTATPSLARSLKMAADDVGFR